MANQVALQVLTRPGDDVIVEPQSHAVWHEAGASAANAGVQFTEIGERGVFTAEEVLAARKPRGHPLYAADARWSKWRTPTTAPAEWSCRSARR